MSRTKENIHCPKCNKKSRVKINSDLTNTDIVDIISRKCFLFNCPNCGESIMLDYPVRLKRNNYIINYTPCRTTSIIEEKCEYMRVCDTFDDFKEKILIFEDNLNDIIIEFIKEFLLNQLDSKMRENVIDIRYDGKNEDNLVFFLCGEKKSIGCSVDFYKEIEKRSKIKTINECIVIDGTSYSSFFKLR